MRHTIFLGQTLLLGSVPLLQVRVGIHLVQHHLKLSIILRHHTEVRRHVSGGHQIRIVDDDVVVMTRHVRHRRRERAQRRIEPQGFQLDVPDHVFLQFLSKFVLEVFRERDLVISVSIIPLGGSGAADLQEFVFLGNLELQWQVSILIQS